MRVGFFFHEVFLKHLEGYSHVESPERLRSILSRLERMDLGGSLIRIEPGPATLELLELVHSPEYVSSILSLEVEEPVVLDWGDTVATRYSVEAALRAAGAGADASRRIISGEIDRAFCAVRPPGHHAERNRAMGFCIFNNIAVTAAHLVENEGIERVAVVDWDVHHGNGTERIFSEDNRVLYISLHQYPHYPGTGSASFRGIGRGVGFTENIPMGYGAGDEDYINAFEERVLPAIDDFEPRFILISAGFDAHEDDPLSGVMLRSETFGRMTEMLAESSERHAGGRIISFLEGGYDLDALAESVEYHLRALAS